MDRFQRVLKTGRWTAMLVAAALSVFACENVSNAASAQPSSTASRPFVVVPLMNAQGQNVATAVITEGLAPELASATRTSSPPRQGSTATTGVTVGIVVSNLPQGTHGFHVLSTGRCDAPNFTTAGAHFNPDNKMHGVKSTGGPHAGDLPNLTVAEDHTALSAFFVSRLTLSQLVSAPNGAALAIDANPDDDMTNPDGGSGPHIACGVIPRGSAATPTPTPMSTSTPTPTMQPTTMTPSPTPTHM